jgi:hypothetical protein
MVVIAYAFSAMEDKKAENICFSNVALVVEFGKN